ncbi:hypothetical protein ASF53_18515 [Methylobacterium sp. Leaf123]|uniref:hypothetical protein n=1 Tax=Methylobacterium sp. Leaf123 TaxID=1736264 RepID=UPI0006FF7428|nr:hypothetical protein [Methylobacterium sp. Leaf123]KQQ29239.1 hypothetical protein ASF53_18515 [Methylobacterium sp. Leaf123]
MTRRGCAGGAGLGLTLLLAAGLPARAAEVTLGSSRFELPALFEGWTRREAGDGLVFERVFEPTTSRGRKGAALLIVAKAKPASGRFDDTFSAFIRSFKQIPPGEKPLTARTGETLDGHRIRVEQRCCRTTDGLRMTAWHIGIATQTSEHFLMLLTLQLEREQQNPIREGFEALVGSYRPAKDDRGLVLAPARNDGGLDGLYTRTKTQLRPNAFGGMDFTADQDTLLFDKGGLYTTELPRDGDMTAHCRSEPQSCGTYALKGGWFSANRIERVAVEDGFGRITRSSEAFSRTKGGLTIGGNTYFAVPPFADGHRFDGMWNHSFGSSGATGSVGGTHNLALTPDGRFTREGGVGFSSTGGATGGGTVVAGHSQRPVRSGRYAVSGYRLTLTDDAGASETLSLFAPDWDSDTLLVIGGANYLKQGR